MVKTIELDGITWELPYWDLLPPLSSPAFEELKNDIEDRGGNLYPILWTPLTGGARRVIDGGHRLRAVAELRAEGWTGELSEQQLSFASLEEEKQAAIDLNIKRRHLTPEQRAEWVARLRQEGKSLREIAEAAGVSKSQVSRDLAGVPFGTPEAITGKDGKSYPAQRPTSSPAGEHPAPRLLISTPEERAAKSGPALYDEAIARKESATTVTPEPTEFEKKTAPLMAQLIREEREKKGPAAIMASGRDDHNTPPELLSVIRAFGGDEIALDPCSNATSTVNARYNFDKEEDGLSLDWRDFLAHVDEGVYVEEDPTALVFINPPYDQETLFLVNDKAKKQAGGWLEIISLVPVKSDQSWFQAALYSSADAVCFIAGRVRFWADGKQQSGAAFESVLFYYGERSEEFCDCFGEEVGVCLNLKLYREARGAA